MQITGKGQITIPANVRDQLGLLPYTEVEFELAGDHVLLRKSYQSIGPAERGTHAIKALRGTADSFMSTDEILSMTRDPTSPADSLK